MTAHQTYQISIRPFSTEYKDRVIDHIVGIQNGEFGIAITAADQPDLADIPGYYQKGCGNFWLAVHDRHVIGTISLLDIGENMAALRKMFVAPEFRGRNAGTSERLLKAALSWAKQHWIKKILLGTTSKFIAAHRFYEKHGFTRIEKADLPGNFPVMTVDTIFYQKKIMPTDKGENHAVRKCQTG